MTTYATLFIGTSLVVVTGTADVLSVAQHRYRQRWGPVATAVYHLRAAAVLPFRLPDRDLDALAGAAGGARGDQTTAPLIALDDVRKSFGAFPVLKGVSLDVQRWRRRLHHRPFGIR